MKDILAKRKITSVQISSAAVSSEEIFNGTGNPVYPPAKAVLLRHGIDCGNKRAVLLKKSDYDKYSLFAVMDSSNLKNAIDIFGGDPHNKIKKLGYFTNGKNISDPWYTRDFETAFKDIENNCIALADIIAKQ